MPKKNLDLCHVSFLYPLLTRMQKAHLGRDYLTSKRDISHFDLNNPTTYLPVPVLYEYLSDLTKDLGVSSLTATFYKDFELNEVGDYGKLISQSPDLLSIIISAITFDKLFQTNSRMHMEVHGTTAKYFYYHTDKPAEGQFISEDMGLAMIMTAFRMVLGNDWRPYAMGLTPSTSKEMLHFVPDPTKAPVHFNSKYKSFTFDTKYLIKPNLKKSEESFSLNMDLTTYSDKIEAVINSFKPGFMPNIKEISKYFNISERTINRGLESEFTSFSKLLQQHLFRKSLELMHDTSMTINEISQYLGYANAANYIRAFRNWTKVTPNTYREQII